MTERPYAEAAARNTAPTLEVLAREFRNGRDILEIGSGTGQHAVAFAEALQHLQWQTSDLDENHGGINAWIEDSGVANVMPPLSIDVRDAEVAANAYDGVYSANTAHIMGIDAVERMFALVGKALRDGGSFCLYGPFRCGGEFNTQSNASFDAGLRRQDPAMGVRDLEALDEFGSVNGMLRKRLYAMPSNNYVAVWQKTGDQ